MKNFIPLSIFFLSCGIVLAEPHFNEIHPRPESGNEWVEVCNSSSDQISKDDIVMIDQAGNTFSISDDFIASQGFSHANLQNILNNSGDTLYLYYKDYLVDMITYPSIPTNNSYLKCDNSWRRSDIATRSFSNAHVCSAQKRISPTPSVEPTTPTPTPISTSLTSLVLNEVYPYPRAGESEWVELLNPHGESVSFSGFIDDIEGGSQPYKLDITIGALDYFIVEFQSSRFNNTGDSIRLLDINEQEISSFSYSDAHSEKSFGLHTDGTYCIQAPSKKTSNTPCIGDDELIETSLAHDNAQGSESVESIVKGVSTHDVSQPQNPPPLTKPVVDFNIKHTLATSTTPSGKPSEGRSFELEEEEKEEPFNLADHPLIITFMLFAVNVLAIGGVAAKPYVTEWISQRRKKSSTTHMHQDV